MLRISVDNGGTSLRILALDGRGRTVLERTLRGVPPAKLPGALRRALRGLARASVLVVGSRGVWLAEERDALRGALEGLADEVFVGSDVELAHCAFFRGGPGVVLIAGTGSIAYGKRGRTVVRAGGLGPGKGDEGSGYWIGKEWLASSTSTSTSTSTRATAEVAALAPEVLRVAPEIAEAAARHLAALAGEAVRRLGAKVPVALHGGLFEDRAFRKRCVAAIRAALRGVRIRAQRRAFDGESWRKYVALPIPPRE